MNKKEQNIQQALEIINLLGKYVGKDFLFNSNNLSKNAESIESYKFPELHLQRQEEYKGLINKKVRQIFNEAELNNFELDDNNGMRTNIMDHHGILNFPALYSGNIVSHFNKLFTKQESGPPIITLDCGNCPLNEPFHRRGFQFHGQQINIFSKYEKNKLVYVMPKFDYNIKKRLIESKKHILFSKQELEFIDKIDSIISQIDYSCCDKYSHQITKINYYLWPLIFEEKLRPSVLDLICLEHDEILVEFLESFLSRDDSFIYQMMFDNKFRDHVLANFRGKYSAWEESREYGTHFFWHIDKEGVQQHLFLNEKNELESDDGFKMALVPEEVIKNLKAGTILPGMFVKFSTLVFYLGVEPMSGIGSVNYLSTLKEIWSSIMPDEFAKERQLIAGIKTDSHIGIGIGYDYNKENDVVQEVWAFDAFFNGGFTKDYLQKFDSMEIRELLRPLIPFAYGYYTNLLPVGERVKIDFDSKELFKPIKRLFV